MPIRQATTGDVAGIRRVARASWEADYPSILSRETVEEGVDEWYGEDRLARELDRGDTVMLVATVDGEVIGFAHGIWTDGVGSILRVYVHPKHRREGVGSGLLAETRDALLDRGADSVRAMVLAENDPGREFYAAFGFEPAEESETTIGGETYAETVYELEL